MYMPICLYMYIGVSEMYRSLFQKGNDQWAPGMKRSLHKKSTSEIGLVYKRFLPFREPTNCCHHEPMEPRQGGEDS